MPCLPKQQAIVNAARELYAIHRLMPVPVSGKVPLGGTGWNKLPLETRLAIANNESCTGIGIQFGLIFHPVLGPLEARGLDCDINDQTQRDTFADTLQSFFPVKHWRWGRRPATIIFTQPGIIKQEKFGPVQLLGEGKQAVWWGDYRNKIPLPGDPQVYWHEGPSIFEALPPIVPAATLKRAIEASLAAAGIPVREKRMLSEAVPLSAADLAMLTPDNLACFKNKIALLLEDVDNSPTGSGRGTKLFNLGLKYGALIKASGSAPMLMDAMHEVCRDVVEYETISNPLLIEIGEIADDAFASLPGSLSQGDKRDFARGVGASMGLSQHVAVEKAKNATTFSGTLQKVLSSGFGQGPAAAAVNADGALDDHPLPSFNSSDALQEIVVKAPQYGIDPAGAVAVAVTLACNLAATKFDISIKGKAVGPHLHMLFIQDSGDFKSTMFTALTGKPLAILDCKAIELQPKADDFEADYQTLKDQMKKSKVVAKPATTLSPKRVFSADTTPQTLNADLQVTAPPAVIVSAEVTQLFDAASLEHAKPLASMIINTYDGYTPDRARMSERKTEGVTAKEANRVTGRTEANRTCRLSLIGSTQSGTWQDILKGPHGKHFDHRGMVPRLLMVAPVAETDIAARATMDRADKDGSDAFPKATASLREMAADFDMLIGRTSIYAREYWPSQAEKPAENTARGFLEERRAKRAKASFPWQRAMGTPFPTMGLSINAPALPDGILLGGDTMHRLKMRLSKTDEDALWARVGGFLKQVKSGCYGKQTPALRAIAIRIAEKVFKLAAGIHAINERDALAQLGLADQNSDALVIPADVIDDAWDFIMHCFIGALNAGLYGHRVRGRETLFEAKQRAWNSPTVESETAGRAADIEGILLSKLVNAPGRLTARDLMQKLSTKQRRMLPNMEALLAALDAAITAGRVTIDGDTYRVARSAN